ncbi:hypothetical protein CD178_01044 [Komagataeibacter saccharivorans]|uniref:Uncharacterized protein n=1 Tax=Komagataeibacter saccharivorans TaxID=265959 RepID=A0A347WAE8_9PROT|nr:hypothetical protein CD178_01044 [Komagataeibacter saccharivorans]
MTCGANKREGTEKASFMAVTSEKNYGNNDQNFLSSAFRASTL